MDIVGWEVGSSYGPRRGRRNTQIKEERNEKRKSEGYISDDPIVDSSFFDSNDTLVPVASAQGQIFSLSIPDTARVVDYDYGIYAVGTSTGDLYIINDAGKYTVTHLGKDLTINDVRIEYPFIAVAANHFYDRYEYDDYTYASYDYGWVIKLVLDGLTPSEQWRTQIWGEGYLYEIIAPDGYTDANLPVPSVDISADGNYVSYLSRNEVGVLRGSDGVRVATYSIAGAWVVSWLDATSDMEYIAITAEVPPYEYVSTGVELYRFDGTSLEKMWSRVLIVAYETVEVRISEAKDYVAVATSSGVEMNLLRLSDGHLLWSYNAGAEQFACDGDENLNYLIGGTQYSWAYGAIYRYFILKNLGTPMK